MYVDPLADDPTDVVATFDKPAVVLWAHNSRITYEYTGSENDTKPYYDIQRGSVIVDPWRQLNIDKLGTQGITVLHYGNTRIKQ